MMIKIVVVFCVIASAMGFKMQMKTGTDKRIERLQMFDGELRVMEYRLELTVSINVP